jgi:hypothetical protein
MKFAAVRPYADPEAAARIRSGTFPTVGILTFNNFRYR